MALFLELRSRRFCNNGTVIIACCALLSSLLLLQLLQCRALQQSAEKDKERGRERERDRARERVSFWASLHDCCMHNDLSADRGSDTSRFATFYACLAQGAASIEFEFELEILSTTTPCCDSYCIIVILLRYETLSAEAVASFISYGFFFLNSSFISAFLFICFCFFFHRFAFSLTPKKKLE